MEKSGQTLDRVQALFGVMTDNMSTAAYSGARQGMVAEAVGRL